MEDGTLLKVTENEVLRFSLYPGMELGEEELAALTEAGRESGAKNRAARMIGARPLSKKELVKRLTEKGEDPVHAQAAADWLEDLGAMNDGEYARAIVRHYSARGYGERRVKDELYRRGVPRDLWEDALSEAPDPGEGIDAYLQSKLRGQAPDQKTLKRVTDGLTRRGYAWPDIQAALRRYGAEVEPD
jgi:regulatory protein